MGSGDLSFVIAIAATGTSVATLLAFAFLRRRETVAWDMGSHGGGSVPDLHVTTDPDIARRIASLVRRPEDRVDAEPAPTREELLSDGSDEWPARDAAPDAVVAALVSSVVAAAPEPPAVLRAEAELDLAWPAVAPGREVLTRLLVDPQTGLGTPLAWDVWVADEDARVRRYRRPATVVLAELDGLDAVGAFHGPEVAEGAAAMIGAAFRSNIRTCDHAAVIGPGLYAVLLPETDEIRAVNFVERVRATCEEWLAVNSPSVRILLGWASPDADGLVGARATAERRLDRERS